MVWRETRIISAFSAASSGSGVVTPTLGSSPSTPRNRRSAESFASACSASGPTSEYDVCRSRPPSIITRICGSPDNSIAIFSALVITVSDSNFIWRICRAISTVVEPESRMIVSPSRIIFAAASPMRSFWACQRVSLMLSGVSCVAAAIGSAPPCERAIAELRASASRSARMVTVDVPKRVASSSTVARPCFSTSSTIRRRRSSTSRRREAIGASITGRFIHGSMFRRRAALSW